MNLLQPRYDDAHQLSGMSDPKLTQFDDLNTQFNTVYSGNVTDQAEGSPQALSDAQINGGAATTAAGPAPAVKAAGMSKTMQYVLLAIIVLAIAYWYFKSKK